MTVQKVGHPNWLSRGVNSFADIPLLGLYANKPALQTDIRYVLWAEVSSSENKITVSTLANKKGKLVLVKIDGVFSVSVDEAKEWSRKLVEVTYGGTFFDLLRRDVA